MKKILLLILTAVCLICTVSCGNKNNSIEEYSLYLPEEASSWERKAVYELADSLKAARDIELDIVMSKENLTDKTVYCGKESLDSSLTSHFNYDTMGYNGFGIASIEGDCVITASTETGLLAAIEYFVNDALTQDNGFSSDLFYIFEGDGAVSADTGKKLNVEISENRGIDVYKVPEIAPAGYRYGPSIIVNDDGSMDMWLAGGGSGLEQWDWIMYMHSEDGVEWSEEKCVLQPTPNSLDHYSVCDPGVIYLNGYYYMGYTSTANENQCDNSLYVARSENPDGPFEKWNGEGWGGNEPKPIVFFSEDQALWGIGEVSFVELDGTLFLYYTEKASEGNVTRVATADANDENWPLTMEHHGIAIKDHTHDAIDVKYMEEYGKFIAVAAEERLTEDSYLIFLESNDGYTFEPVDACKENVYFFCHNPGISGRANGHIRPGDKTYVSYAYGEGWGIWNTRLQEMTVTLASSPDFIEINGINVRSDIARDTRDVNLLETAGISSLDKCVMRVPLNQQFAMLTLAKCNVYRMNWKNLNDYTSDVKLYGYDESIITQTQGKNLMFRLHSVGETMVTVDYKGHLTYVYVIVYDPDADPEEIVSVEPMAYDTINMNTEGSYQPQIKSIVTYADGSWEMAWAQAEHGISYEYDTNALTINENSYILPKKAGEHKVTIKAGDKSCVLTVNVTTPDYTKIDFTADDAHIGMLREINNCEAELTDKGLKLTTTKAEDPFITVDYTEACMVADGYSKITVKYMIPKENSQKSYASQTFFRCGADSVLAEETSLRKGMTKSGTFVTLSHDLAGKEFWSGDITEIRLDFFDTCGEGDVIYIESIELS